MSPGRRLAALGLAASLAALPVAESRGQARPDRKGPAIRSVVPPGVTPGTKARLILRGRGLDRARSARLSPSIAVVALVEHAKDAPPMGIDGAAVGDTRAVVELELPAESAREPIALAVETPDGETELYPIAIDRTPPTREREPNAGFRDAQPIEAGSAVDGSIERPQDVDVYRIRGRAGDRLTVAVSAGRGGSALDPLLSLYDERGRLLALADDAPTGGDERLELVLPEDGAYLAVVMDAQDRGGPLYAYRLNVQAAPGPGPAATAGRFEDRTPARIRP